MTSVVLQHAVSLVWVTTLAAVFVALARVPLRGVLGARAAYWLWLAVPGSALALPLPHLDPPAGASPLTTPGVFGWVWAGLDALGAGIRVSGPLGAATCTVWVMGVAATIAFMVLRQHSFARSLGILVPSPDGTWRGAGVAEPMLIGAFRPRVLIPLDFEARYGAEERAFVLAHEREHMRRRDTLVNAFGAAWLCLFWFNPVMFRAMRLLRFDQDLACDAAVLASAGRGCRGRYAEALLKAQLAGEGTLPLPIACHWGSVHPLRRRIAALRRPATGRIRHGVGILLVASLAAGASLAARAAQPSLHVAQPVAPHAASRAASAVSAASAGKVCPLSRRRAEKRQSRQPRARAVSVM